MKCNKSWRHKTLHGHQRVSSRLPLTGVRGAQGQWACACPRGEGSITTDTYGQTVVCLRRQLAMISSETPATARNAKGILTEYLCGKNTFDSATLFVLFVNTFECSMGPGHFDRSSHRLLQWVYGTLRRHGVEGPQGWLWTCPSIQDKGTGAWRCKHP